MAHAGLNWPNQYEIAAPIDPASASMTMKSSGNSKGKT
jgi:hypothetical protein